MPAGIDKQQAMAAERGLSLSPPLRQHFVFDLGKKDKAV
jgi:hypothetical protein